jgi:hypothetical protein
MRRQARVFLQSHLALGVKPTLESLSAVFDQPGIVAAYLFGSFALGRANPLSDIDLAYLGSDYKTEDSLFDLIYEDLQRRLGEGNFDLIPLRRAPLHLKFQVVTAGTCLINREPLAAEDFAAQAIVRYLDFKPYRDAYFAAGGNCGSRSR